MTVWRKIDTVQNWQSLAQISADLQNARFDPSLNQKVVIIGEVRVPFEHVIDRVTSLRPQFSSMMWNGDYLTIARRIKAMANQVGYQPKASFWFSCIERCFVCSWTSGCRERSLFEDAEMTERELLEGQFWQDHLVDLPP